MQMNGSIGLRGSESYHGEAASNSLHHVGMVHRATSSIHRMVRHNLQESNTTHFESVDVDDPHFSVAC